MMTVVFTEPEKYLYSASGYFNSNHLDEWMCDPLVQKMIKSVDRVELANPHAGFSPILGSISVRELSGGVKGLILVYKEPDFRAFSSTIWGNNCAEWLCQLSFLVDFVFYVRHPFCFFEGSHRNAPPVLDRAVSAIGYDGTVCNTAIELSEYLCKNGM